MERSRYWRRDLDGFDDIIVGRDGRKGMGANKGRVLKYSHPVTGVGFAAFL